MKERSILAAMLAMASLPIGENHGSVILDSTRSKRCNKGYDTNMLRDDSQRLKEAEQRRKAKRQRRLARKQPCP